MMNDEVSGKRLSCSSHGTIQQLAWDDWENPRKTSEKSAPWKRIELGIHGRVQYHRYVRHIASAPSKSASPAIRWVGRDINQEEQRDFLSLGTEIIGSCRQVAQ